MKPYPLAPLGDVCVIVGGGTPHRGTRAYFDGDIPWARPTDVTRTNDLFIKRTSETISELGLRESNARLVPPGTVLLTTRATIGYTAIASKPMATNQGFANLVCDDVLDPEYLAFWLRSYRPRLVQLAGGTTFREISKSTLRKIDIPIPPLCKQRRIASIFRHLLRIKHLRSRNLELIHEFTQALFVSMFGDPINNPMRWKVEPLRTYNVFTQYGTSKKPNDESIGIPVIRMGNVTYDGRITCDSVKYVELPKADSEKYALHPGDLLFNRTNSKELVGKTGIWDGRFPAVAASYFIQFRVNEDVLCPAYVWAFMNSRATKRRLFNIARGAIGQANINTLELHSLPIPVPPIEIQTLYAERVASARRVVPTSEVASKAASTLTESLVSLFWGDRPTFGPI